MCSSSQFSFFIFYKIYFLKKEKKIIGKQEYVIVNGMMDRDQEMLSQMDSQQPLQLLQVTYLEDPSPKTSLPYSPLQKAFYRDMKCALCFHTQQMASMVNFSGRRETQQFVVKKIPRNKEKRGKGYFHFSPPSPPHLSFSLSPSLPLSLSLSLNFSLALLFSIVNIVFFLQLRRDSERAEFPGNDECVGIQTLLLVTAESLARRL